MLNVSSKKAGTYMNIKIVHLNQKIVVGLNARTANNNPEMQKTIGGLWKRLMADNIASAISDKCNNRFIGLYSDYESDVSGEYDITVGCEVKGAGEHPAGTVIKTIPPGNYAEFTVYGNEAQAVGELWQKIWNMQLDRIYTGDFEEYLFSPEGIPLETHIYIAVK